jgi:cell division protein FtsB
MPLLNLQAAQRPSPFASRPGGGKKQGKKQTKKEKHMSVKEVGLIVIFAFIAIGGFIFLAPEYQKNAQLKESLDHNQKMVNKLKTKIEHDDKMVRKLDAGDPATITRVLRERFGFCPPNEMVIQFQNNEKQND